MGHHLRAWRRVRLRFALAIGLLSTTRSRAGAQTDTSTASAKPAPKFFRDLPYGSDTQFNPWAVLLNHGFDQLRTSPRRDFTMFPYGASFSAVLRSVVRPDKSIRRYGVSNWLRDEVFPLTLKSNGGGQWYPNYTLHLFGSGVTYVRLIDWYRDNGVESHPELAAGLTHFAYHLLVEANENGPTADRGVDALTDLLVFDVASIVVWNQDWTRRLFSGSVEVTDWYGQISLGEPGRTIENASSMVVVRAPLPLTRDWKVMVTHGLVFLVGLSRRVGSDGWVTVGGGWDAPANPVIDPNTGKKTATLEPNGGLFIDRGGSLLLSLITRSGSNNGPTLNIYPGVIGRGAWSPGLWIQQNRGGGFRFGISSRFGVGLSTFAGIH
jgi:hypothetical protein